MLQRASRHRVGMRRARGSAMLGLLLGAAMLVLLTVLYMAPAPGGGGGPGAKPWPQQKIDEARALAMDMNTITANTNYTLWRAQTGGRVDPAGLAQWARSQSMGGSEGAWIVDEEKVVNVVNVRTPTFAELMGLY
jgi:hypothetical protein